MRDEERIEMYYKFGLLDWRSEQQAEKINKENNRFAKNSLSSTITKIALSLGIAKHSVNNLKQ